MGHYSPGHWILLQPMCPSFLPLTTQTLLLSTQDHVPAERNGARWSRGIATFGPGDVVPLTYFASPKGHAIAVGCPPTVLIVSAVDSSSRVRLVWTAVHCSRIDCLYSGSHREKQRQPTGQDQFSGGSSVPIRISYASISSNAATCPPTSTGPSAVSTTSVATSRFELNDA